MPGTQRVFVDVQWLKPLKQNQYDWTLFNRTRLTVNYNNQSDIFSAFYLNYTTKYQFGPSLLGAISNTNGTTAAGGVHFIHNTSSWMLFALLSTEIKESPAQSLFVISRYRPSLNEQWKGYFSLEILSAIHQGHHRFSLQRIRAGVERTKWQFGAALNLSQAGKDFVVFANPGVFVRKEF